MKDKKPLRSSCFLLPLCYIAK